MRQNGLALKKQAYDGLLEMIKFELKSGTKGLSKQIETQISELIAKSELLPGQRLPTVKDISGTYGINHQTVLKAYKNLKTKGLIESYRGGRAKVKMPRRSKEILVVFDINSFTENLSPGYFSFMKRIQADPTLRNIKTQKGEIIKEVRLTPLLSSQISDEFFFNSNLIENFIDAEKRPLGLLMIGYSASKKIQQFLNAIGIPYVGVGSVGQYLHQTILPFTEFISRGMDYAAKNKYRKTALLYQSQPEPDKLPLIYKSVATSVNIKPDENLIFSVNEFSEAQAKRIAEKIAKRLSATERLLMLSTDDLMSINIYEILKKKDKDKLPFLDIFTMWTKDFSSPVEYPFTKALVDAKQLFDSALDIMLELISKKEIPPKTITVSMQL